jgi:hypothetical protein
VNAARVAGRDGSRSAVRERCGIGGSRLRNPPFGLRPEPATGLPRKPPDVRRAIL